MAASVLNISRIFSRELISASFQFHRYLRLKPAPTSALFTHQLGSSAACWQEAEVQAAQTADRYKQRPWDYLDSEGFCFCPQSLRFGAAVLKCNSASYSHSIRRSQNMVHPAGNSRFLAFAAAVGLSMCLAEYVERYGSSVVWAGYRRNHKGGIPPQKTRKTCIRGDKICGNPCPICRDPNIIIHHQNVKLLQQFISPHSGMVYDPTLTGVCMKQQKKLNEAIDKARDDGLLPFQIPHVDFSGKDYCNSHDAVGLTSPPPFLSPSGPWYKWYGEISPDDKKVDQLKKIYKAYLKH